MAIVLKEPESFWRQNWYQVNLKMKALISMRTALVKGKFIVPWNLILKTQSSILKPRKFLASSFEMLKTFQEIIEDFQGIIKTKFDTCKAWINY